jgi:hypothetical protein
MSILVIDGLEAAGIPVERVLVEQDVEGDELDCVADINGQLVLFELKGKDFNLGNAYSFGSKIGVLRPERSVVVTSGKVGKDAKNHFERTELSERQSHRSRFGMDQVPEFPELEAGQIAEPRVTYIEGVGELRARVSELVGNVNARDAASLLAEALPCAALDPESVVGLLAAKG